MRIWFFTRPDIEERIGGDTIQVLNLLNELEKLHGFSVSLNPDIEINSTNQPDIVHIFNIQTDDHSAGIASEIRAAFGNNVPIVITPIYWNLFYSYIVTRFLDLDYVCRVLFLLQTPLKKILSRRQSGYLSVSQQKKTSTIFQFSDAAIINSPEELRCIEKDFPGAVSKSLLIRFAPNCISNIFLGRNPQLLRQISTKKSCIRVTVVGRIEPTKNQLRVLRAVAKIPGATLTFVGRWGTCAKYNQIIKNEASKLNCVEFKTECSQEEVAEILMQTDVHVLASFRESPGLSTLEALACGCGAVVSDSRFCPIQYYDLVRTAAICNPLSVESIRAAILSALHRKPLAPINLEKFRYSQVAKLHSEIYSEIISQRSASTSN